MWTPKNDPLFECRATCACGETSGWSDDADAWIEEHAITCPFCEGLEDDLPTQ